MSVYDRSPKPKGSKAFSSFSLASCRTLRFPVKEIVVMTAVSITAILSITKDFTLTYLLSSIFFVADVCIMADPTRKDPVFFAGRHVNIERWLCLSNLLDLEQPFIHLGVPYVRMLSLAGDEADARNYP